MNEYKKEIDRLTNELHEMKRKFFEQKKKEVSIKEKELKWFSDSGFACIENAYREGVENFVDQNKKESQVVSSHRQKIRFVGGGFAVK